MTGVILGEATTGTCAHDRATELLFAPIAATTMNHAPKTHGSPVA